MRTRCGARIGRREDGTYIRWPVAADARLCGFPGCYEYLCVLGEDCLAGERTPCSTDGCTGWSHYNHCFTRFCDGSEYYPGLDPDPNRQGLMITFCYECALIDRQDYRRLFKTLDDYSTSPDSSQLESAPEDVSVVEEDKTPL